jgi:hypothetical protein
VSAEYDERSGWPSTNMTENVEKILQLIHEDRSWTIHELADTVGINYGVCQEILTENLNMHRIAPSRQRARPRPRKPQSLWLTTWLSFPILPTCQT